MESSPREDAVKVAEMATDLEYHINLVEKAATEFEKSDCNFERSSVWVEYYQTALCATEKLFMKGRVNSMLQTSVLSYFKKSPWPPHPSVTAGSQCEELRPWQRS